jgi:molecular chaperone GrpE (heat shock protein)
VEHVERQDEREQELKSEVDDLEQRADDLEDDGQRLDEKVDAVREEFERRKQSSEVPGAQEADAHLTGTSPAKEPRPEEDE